MLYAFGKYKAALMRHNEFPDDLALLRQRNIWYEVFDRKLDLFKKEKKHFLEQKDVPAPELLRQLNERIELEFKLIRE